MSLRDQGVSSVRQRMQRIPGPLLDVGLVLLVATAILIVIGVAPQPGRRPDALAYLLGLTIAGLVLVRRRWPVAVLVVSAAALQLYYVLDYAGIRPAVPLSVALATAWAAGHPRWSLAVAAWFGGAPLLFRTLIDPEPVRQVLDDSVPDVVLLAAVLVLGEAIRNRRELDLEREKSERLLLNVLPGSIAARLKQTEGVIADDHVGVTDRLDLLQPSLLSELVERREQLVEDPHHPRRAGLPAAPGGVDDAGEQHGDLGEGVGDDALAGFEPGGDRDGQHVEQQPLGPLLLQRQRAAAAHRLSQHQHGSEHGRVGRRITQQGQRRSCAF